MSFAPKSEALRALYWRSEILRVVYWLRGEGLGDLVDPPLIEQYLDLGADEGLRYLDSLVARGYLVRDGDWFRLSSKGMVDHEPRFATAFSDLIEPTGGPCSDQCWCHLSDEEAQACCNGQGRVAPEALGI